MTDAEQTDDLGETNRDAELVNQDPDTITVWSDIGCPWATLALDTLHRAAVERGVVVSVDHRAFPLELFNGTPTPKELIESELTVIASSQPQLEWQLWNAPHHSYPSTTLAALEAVQAAKDPDVGGLRASDELDTALRRAFFVDSRCISLHSVVLDVAETCELVDHAVLAESMAKGIGRSEVYRQRKAAEGDGVGGSPHFLTAGGFDRHNPGVTFSWTASPPRGFPFEKHGFPALTNYDSEWARELIDSLTV